MESIFGLLILLSFVMLIVGLISPKSALFWDKKNAPTRKRAALIYGISLVACFILFGTVSDNNPKDNNVSEDTSVTIEEELDVKPILTQQQIDSIEAEKIKIKFKERENQTITASNLTASYEANEVQADENFKGKTFFVEGTVSDIKKDILDHICPK